MRHAVPTPQLPNGKGVRVQGLARMDSIASVGSRDYALMIEDMASLSLEPLEEGTGPDILDYLGRGFSSSGTFTLADGREVDIGVDWSEPLDVKARAIRRALKRKLGPSVFTRYAAGPSS